MEDPYTPAIGISIEKLRPLVEGEVVMVGDYYGLAKNLHGPFNDKCSEVGKKWNPRTFVQFYRKKISKYAYLKERLKYEKEN